jgi:hypothetical protein
MKRTVYIPVELECNDEHPMTEDEAVAIANSIVSQVKDGFYNDDNVWDAASETLGEQGMIDFGYSIRYAVAEVKS